MKKLFIALMIISSSTSAFATSSIQTEARCTLAQAKMDLGILVEINSYTGPGTIGKSPIFSAEVSKFMLGHKTVTEFTKLRKITPKAGVMGGSVSYTGQDFNLELLTDSAPQTDGKVRAELTYEINGARNVEQMNCDLNPSNN